MREGRHRPPSVRRRRASRASCRMGSATSSAAGPRCPRSPSRRPGTSRGRSSGARQRRRSREYVALVPPAPDVFGDAKSLVLFRLCWSRLCTAVAVGASTRAASIPNGSRRRKSRRMRSTSVGSRGRDPTTWPLASNHLFCAVCGNSGSAAVSSPCTRRYRTGGATLPSSPVSRKHQRGPAFAIGYPEARAPFV